MLLKKSTTGRAAKKLYVPLADKSRDRKSTGRSVGEYISGKVYMNDIESSCWMTKRYYIGTYHDISVKHLDRYLAKFVGRDNQRNLHTLNQIEAMEARIAGSILTYKKLMSKAA